MWATRCDELEADIVLGPAAICHRRTTDDANLLRMKRRHCLFERPPPPPPPPPLARSPSSLCSFTQLPEGWMCRKRSAQYMLHVKGSSASSACFKGGKYTLGWRVARLWCESEQGPREIKTIASEFWRIMRFTGHALALPPCRCRPAGRPPPAATTSSSLALLRARADLRSRNEKGATNCITAAERERASRRRPFKVALSVSLFHFSSFLSLSLSLSLSPHGGI